MSNFLPIVIVMNVMKSEGVRTDMPAEVLGEGVPEALMNLHAIRRIATLEEVSALICHLAGPNGSYITGGVIDVAGGLAI
ncbi:MULTISPECIES: SDR family oxidoreductase [unclassified Rhizobium]|uniref:SDR family oxidoreductase n=2 Tax=Rhizobium TaxID=379 RepID=UPI00299D4B48|nr:SDR family oxidoreductase [Rhizobium sp. BT-226]